MTSYVASYRGPERFHYHLFSANDDSWAKPTAASLVGAPGPLVSVRRRDTGEVVWRNRNWKEEDDET